MSAAKKKLDTDQVASDLSESAFFQPVSTQTHKTTSTQVDKPTKPLVEKYTTHLLPSTIKAIKIFAAEHDLKDYEVVQAALIEFLERHKRESQHVYLNTTEYSCPGHLTLTQFPQGSEQEQNEVTYRDILAPLHQSQLA